MMYLVNKYGNEENQFLYPLEPDQRGIVDKFLFFDMGTLAHAIEEYFVSRTRFQRVILLSTS